MSRSVGPFAACAWRPLLCRRSRFGTSLVDADARARSRRLIVRAATILLTVLLADCSVLAPVLYGPDAAMKTGSPMPSPNGFARYCLHFPTECTARTETPEVIHLTGDAEDTLESVQAAVNNDVRPAYNPFHRWQYPAGGYGDCNSYALEKKRQLIAKGLPPSALLLAAAWTEGHEGHLVLVARTDHGDLVLDNRFSGVLEWTELPYWWVERQSENNPATWVQIIAPKGPGISGPPIETGACSRGIISK